MNTPNYPALVLNADFTPVSVYPLSTWSFERTLRNHLKERIVPLEFYDAVLRSPTFEYTPPSVVVLKEYVKRPNRLVFSRLNIFLRDNFTCQYCGSKFHTSELTFDHVVPRAKGGATSFENIVSACVPCNTRKGSKQHMKPLRKPFIPNTRDLVRARPIHKDLHKSWIDYLYWSGVLEK